MVHGVVEDLATIEEINSDESSSSLNNDKVIQGNIFIGFFYFTFLKLSSKMRSKVKSVALCLTRKSQRFSDFWGAKERSQSQRADFLCKDFG